MSDSRQGFELDIGIIDHFKTQLVIPLKYGAIANFHTLNKLLAHTLNHFQPHSVFTSSCLVTASNNGYSYSPGLKSFLNGGSLLTAYSCN
jgi:hypothetical protein